MRFIPYVLLILLLTGCNVAQTATPTAIGSPTNTPQPTPTSTPTPEPTSTFTPEPTHTPTPTPEPIGSRKSNPVPMGQPGKVTRYGEGYCNLSVRQIVRGDEAASMMYVANMFNGVPENKSYQWMLVYFDGDCPSAPEGGILLSMGFSEVTVVANARNIPQPLSSIPPPPSIDGVYYEGAVIQGWAAFFVDKSEPIPLLLIKDNPLENKGTWFALGE